MFTFWCYPKGEGEAVPQSSLSFYFHYPPSDSAQPNLTNPSEFYSHCWFHGIRITFANQIVIKLFTIYLLNSSLSINSNCYPGRETLCYVLLLHELKYNSVSLRHVGPFNPEPRRIGYNSLASVTSVFHCHSMERNVPEFSFASYAAEMSSAWSVICFCVEYRKLVMTGALIFALRWHNICWIHYRVTFCKVFCIY